MKNGTLKRLLAYVMRHPLALITSIACALVSSAAALYLPFVFGEAIDEINGDVSIEALVPLLIRAGIVITVYALCILFMNLANNRITCLVSADLRGDMASALNKISISYLDKHSTGDGASRIIYDVDRVSDGLLIGLSQLFCGLVTIAGTIGFMLKIRWQIAAIVIVLTPVSLLLARFIATRTYKMFKAQSEINGEMTGFTNETVSAQKVVHAFCGAVERDYARFTELNERLKKTSFSATFFSSLVNPTTRVVNNIIYAIVALIGAILVITFGGGAITVGGLTSLLAYASQYAKPFNEISGVVTEMESSIASAERIFEFIDAEKINDNGKDELNNVIGNVELENVDFSYVADKKIIENFSLKVAPGKNVAIVGPTGCGKTTIINLLMRFYDVDTGTIKIDGTLTDSVSMHSLRKNFGMVLQDTWLRAGSVKDNIRLAKPTATDEEIVNAAKAAFADGFIRRLPNGYDTVISGDSGLSEGEKQLICIARIMLCDPPMLILDEATSSIDLCTEVEIRKAFNKAMEGRTSFVVAHRLSTIKECDLIVVMKDGKIIELGDHDTLLALGGFYAELYEAGKK